MSFVIPLSQLQRTVLTLRCEDAKPQVECSFDGLLPQTAIPVPDTGSEPTVRKQEPSLSVLYGQDDRGHYVRFSFTEDNTQTQKSGQTPPTLSEATTTRATPSLAGDCTPASESSSLHSSPENHNIDFGSFSTSSSCTSDELTNMDFSDLFDYSPSSFDVSFPTTPWALDIPLLENSIIPPNPLSPPLEPPPLAQAPREMFEWFTPSSSSSSSSPEPPSLTSSPIPLPSTLFSDGRAAETLQCPYVGCMRMFKTRRTLRGHLKTHTSSRARFACSYPPCTEQFSRRHDQLRHEVYKHGRRSEWVCPRCRTFFSYERSLEKHLCPALERADSWSGSSSTGSSDL